MIRMFLFELKKICTKKSTLVSVFILAIFILGFTITDILGNSWISRDGNSINGLDAISAQRQEQVSGTLDSQTIVNTTKKYQGLINKKSNLDEHGELNSNIYRETWQKYSQIEDLITRAYSSTGSWDSSILKNINYNRMDDIYKMRINSIKGYLALSYGYKDYTEEERQGFLNLAAELKTPIEFEYSKGYESILAQLPLLQLALLLITAICLGMVFSSDYESRVSQITGVTKNGRTRLYFAKVFASFVFISTLTIISIIVLVITKGMIYGFSGYQNYIQSIAKYWLSVYPYTFINAVILASIMMYLSIIFYSLIVLFISKISKSTYVTVAISILVLIAPFFIKNLFVNKFTYAIFSLNPLDIGNFDLSVRMFSSYNAFGIFETYLQVSFLVCILCSLIMGLIVVFSNSKVDA